MLQIALGLLFELLFCSLASATPITAEGHGNAWQYGAGGGVIGFIILVLDIIVFSMSTRMLKIILLAVFSQLFLRYIINEGCAIES